ncbi:MAG: hypothetical protein LC721_03390, partial [Actinobacteria bacterium]|nr:hypothetical protein [Actinomycetota bacterium]
VRAPRTPLQGDLGHPVGVQVGVSMGLETGQTPRDHRVARSTGKDIDYDGPSGPLEFTDPGEPPTAAYVINKIQPDGTVKPLSYFDLKKSVFWR